MSGTIIGGSDGPTSIFIAGNLGVSWINIFGITTAKTLHPIFALIECTKDGGGVVKATFRQFQKKLHIFFRQLRHPPLVKNQHLECTILVQHLVLSARKD